MMWSVATIFALFIHVTYAQHAVFQLWTETGAKYKINKEWDFSLDWTNRIDGYGLKTSFPQASIRYKAFNWLKASLDYRWIIAKQDNGYYSTGNRINANIQANHKFERLDVGIRARYQ